MKIARFILFFIYLSVAGIYNQAVSQTITGAWKGKIGSVKTELKLIKKGDTLVGTCYYYTSRNSYRRYAVRGYFDGGTNSVIWWDEELLENRLSGKWPARDRDALLAIADFNCPGEDEMLLEGASTFRDDMHTKKDAILLQKTTGSIFKDEWDFVINNYTAGANDPYLIDSIDGISRSPRPAPAERELATTEIPQVPSNETDIKITAPVKEIKMNPAPVSANDQKFASRKKTLATVIPVTGDSVELRFYDNAVVDGDSIAVFLNNRLLFEHVRLNTKAYKLMLPVNELLEDNELVMVAENLGSIPPNTSSLVVIIGDKRYEARLESTEESSALIRFIKQSRYRFPVTSYRL